AIKFLDPAFTADQREFPRVRREILLSRRIGDPRIVRIFSLDCWQGIHYLVMELVEGRSLTQVIEANGALPWKTIAPFFIQVLEALAALHESGIVHRDIKPGNIMVGTAGQVKLLDFGLAREVWEPEGSSPQSGIVGSLYYLSPEQIQGGELDGRSDLYQLGLVLYRLLAGRHPFVETTPQGLVVKHLSATPPALKRPAVPGWVEAMLERLLQKRPERRFASARGVLRFLQRTARSPVRRLLAGLRRRRCRWLLAILGTLLSLGVLLLAQQALGH
ncbi:MAG TPA: serine/threonine-protein kinase, partial [Candidatus Aminicenantes bacterium]|nr:serine/threonine-protein kinase [Candidatus Aminicenantes bacterium]